MTEKQMMCEMYRAMHEMLGEGYVREYYEQAAADFISIAKAYAENRVGGE